MLVTLKTLQRETFLLEIDEEKTVRDLKNKIEEDRGNTYAAVNLKLIYAGKILADDKPLKEYGIETFVVVMVSKPKAASSPSDGSSTNTQNTPTSTQGATTTATTTTAPAPQATAQQAEAVAQAPETVTPAPVQPATDTTRTVTSESTTPGDTTSNMFVSGQEYDNAVQEMINMGFERPQIERAMAASFMNPHRAIEYLFNPDLMPVQAPPAQQQQPPTQPQSQTTAPTSEGGNTTQPASRNLDFLRNSPQLQVLRRMVAEDPSMLQGILEEVRSSNPELLQAIQENPQQFISLLNEGASEGGDATGGLPPAAGGGGGGAPNQPLPGTMQITREEKEAIDRIKALGFPEHLVIQAYFACEKDENLAADFLLSENYQDDS